MKSSIRIGQEKGCLWGLLNPNNEIWADENGHMLIFDTRKAARDARLDNPKGYVFNNTVCNPRVVKITYMVGTTSA
jgi:hypothetical protein